MWLAVIQWHVVGEEHKNHTHMQWYIKGMASQDMNPEHHLNARTSCPYDYALQSISDSESKGSACHLGTHSSSSSDLTSATDVSMHVLLMLSQKWWHMTSHCCCPKYYNLWVCLCTHDIIFLKNINITFLKIMAICSLASLSMQLLIGLGRSGSSHIPLIDRQQLILQS